MLSLCLVVPRILVAYLLTWALAYLLSVTCLLAYLPAPPLLLLPTTYYQQLLPITTYYYLLVLANGLYLLYLQRQAVVAVGGADEHRAPAVRFSRVNVLHAGYGKWFRGWN